MQYDIIVAYCFVLLFEAYCLVCVALIFHQIVKEFCKAACCSYDRFNLKGNKTFEVFQREFVVLSLGHKLFDRDV